MKYWLQWRGKKVTKVDLGGKKIKELTFPQAVIFSAPSPLACRNSLDIFIKYQESINIFLQKEREFQQ